jgi:hypothetical protein
MRISGEESLTVITALIIVPAFAMAVGTPLVLILKLSDGGAWSQCVPAITFYLTGWIALILMAARPNHSLPLWSFISGVLLALSVLLAGRVSIPFRSESIDISQVAPIRDEVPRKLPPIQPIQTHAIEVPAKQILGTDPRILRKPPAQLTSFNSPRTASSNSVFYIGDTRGASGPPAFVHHDRFRNLFPYMEHP